MQNLSTNSDLILVDDSGHCIMCDQPDVFFDALQEVIRAA
jgi:pimeloyl-ACP methyl ester carboxylesterase